MNKHTHTHTHIDIPAAPHAYPILPSTPTLSIQGSLPRANPRVTRGTEMLIVCQCLPSLTNVPGDHGRIREIPILSTQFCSELRIALNTSSLSGVGYTSVLHKTAQCSIPITTRQNQPTRIIYYINSRGKRVQQKGLKQLMLNQEASRELDIISKRPVLG